MTTDTTPDDGQSGCSEGDLPPPDVNNMVLCPVSQTPGRRVDLITVKALLKGTAIQRLDGREYRFCSSPDCDIVYFDGASGAVFRKADLVVRVGRKEKDDPRPICYCFDFTIADLRREILETGETDIPERITEQIRGGHCACEEKNPEGCCCLGDVRGAVKSIRAEVGNRDGGSPPSRRAET